MVALAPLVVLATANSAVATPASPSGGCPQPPNSLLINEISVGSVLAPRWFELVNPGKYTLSLKNVFAVVTPIIGSKPSTNPDDVKIYDLGAILAELPAGEAVALGFVPPNVSTANALLKTKIVEIGPDFVLPCGAKLTIDGPNGMVDAVSWDLCGTKEYKGIWGLDPSQADICTNDDLKMWCQPKGDVVELGTPGKVNMACDLDADSYPSVAAAGAAADCDDLNKQVFPGAIEVCNGIDDDCNGQTDEGLAALPGTCLAKGVCINPLPDGKPVAHCDGVGGFSCTYPYGYESVNETLCDGFDNDCDGLTDEGLTNACSKCGSVPLETCNGADDDCDGQTDDVADLPQTCTSTGVCSAAKSVCLAGQISCVMPLNHQATETLCDGMDNDCDGDTDEELGKDTPCTKGTGVCTGAGIRKCSSSGKVVCEAEERNTPVAELCGDGLDNNCDGQTDEGFAVGAQCEAGKGICRVVGKRVCGSDTKKAVCNVAPLVVAVEERCGNALDDDCDGQTDEPTCEKADDGAVFTCQARPFGSAPNAAGLLGLVIAVTALVMRRQRLAMAQF